MTARKEKEKNQGEFFCFDFFFPLNAKPSPSDWGLQCWGVWGHTTFLASQAQPLLMNTPNITCNKNVQNYTKYLLIALADWGENPNFSMKKTLKLKKKSVHIRTTFASWNKDKLKKITLMSNGLSFPDNILRLLSFISHVVLCCSSRTHGTPSLTQLCLPTRLQNTKVTAERPSPLLCNRVLVTVTTWF